MLKIKQGKLTAYRRLDILDQTRLFSHEDKHASLCTLIDDALERIAGFKNAIKGITVVSSADKNSPPLLSHLTFYCWVSATHGLMISRSDNGRWDVCAIDATVYDTQKFKGLSQLDAQAREYVIPETQRLWD